MAPTTRSGGVPPSSRVYHSSPSLQQAQFRPRRTTVRTYGRQRTKSETRRLRQQTLTQIDFVSSSAQKEDDPIILTDSEEEDFGRDKENQHPDVEDAELEDQELASSGTKRKASSRSRAGAVEVNKNKRRRTLGDGPIKTKAGKSSSRRRTMGDSPTPSSSYHTQTLTQLLGANRPVHDSGEEEDDGFDDWLGQTGSPRSPGIQSKISGSPSPSHSHATKDKGALRETSIIPATPVRHIRFEIPSSSQQSTPLTSMIARYGPLGKQVSPLKGRSPNIAPMPDELPGKPSAKLRERPATPRAPRLVVEDTFASESLGSTATSPTKTTPAQSQFPRNIHEDESPQVIPSSSSIAEDLSSPSRRPRKGRESSVLGEPKPKTPTPLKVKKKVKTPSPNKRRTTLLEIPDSDDEDEGFGETEDEMSHTSPGGYDAGAETQIAMNAVKTPLAKAPLRASATRSSSDDTPSQPSAPPIPSSPSQRDMLPPPRKRLRRPIHQPASHLTQAYPAESQRVPLAILQGWPAASMRTDILLPTSPTVLSNLLAGFQVSITLPYRVLTQVVRFWLFDGAVLRYMACPQQGTSTGGDGSWHYHLSQIYELNNPMEKDDMEEEGWIDGPIGRYVYLPPAVVAQLLWNLRHAIFDDNEQAVDENRDSSPTPSASLSQQIEAQIQSDIAYSTQIPTSDSILVPSTPEDEQDQESEEDALPTIKAPKTWPIKPPPLQPQPSTRTRAQPSVRLSQATTASQASTFDDQTTPQQPSLPHSSSPTYQDYGGSIPLGPESGAMPLPSSQSLLTKSQMISDSLITDDVGNPTEVWDSEEDDEARL